MTRPSEQGGEGDPPRDPPTARMSRSMRKTTCEECGAPLPEQHYGRPRVHCSDRCRTRKAYRLYRARKALKETMTA